MKKDEFLLVGLYKFPERICTDFFYIAVWVFLVGNKDKLNIQPFLNGKIQPPQCCFNSRGIAIINDGQVVGVFFYQPKLVWRQGSSSGGHYIFYPRLVHGCNIRIPLYQETFICFVYGLSCKIGSIQDPAFDVQFVLRGIDVFGATVTASNYPCSKSNDLAALVVDGKDDAAPVIVCQLTIALYAKATFFEQFMAVLALDGFSCKSIALVKAIAQLEFFDGFIVKATFLEIAQCIVSALF